jgi:hypothetical protein
MNRILFILSVLIVSSVSAEENSFSISLFDINIQLPNSCLWQLTDTVENNEIAVFKCDKCFDHEVSVVVQKFDYSKIMQIKNSIEVTHNSESKIGNITHFHIEAAIGTSRGDSENFIDAFCDPSYCIATFGTNNSIAKSIASQLKSIPNKAIKQD